MTAVGLHPTQVAGVVEDGVRALVDKCTEVGWAIGEMDLDYCRGMEPPAMGFGRDLPAGDSFHASGVRHLTL